MSMPEQDPRTRYTIESVAFAPDLNSILVRLQDPSLAGGPVLGSTTEVEINIRDDDDVRAAVWEMCNTLCDIYDESHREMRAAQR